MRLIWFIYGVVVFILILIFFNGGWGGALSRLVYLLRELLHNQSISYTLCPLFLFALSKVVNFCLIITLHLIYSVIVFFAVYDVD